MVGTTEYGGDSGFKEGCGCFVRIWSSGSIIDQKKKANEKELFMAEASVPVKEDVKTKTKDKGIDFSSSHSFTNSANKAKEFPSLAEADKLKQTTKKEVPKKSPEPDTSIPMFTNTKKTGDKPKFTALEGQKELSHHNEVTSSPYKGSDPREFKVGEVDESRLREMRRRRSRINIQGKDRESGSKMQVGKEGKELATRRITNLRRTNLTNQRERNP